jgi:hypothetical protein
MSDIPAVQTLALELAHDALNVLSRAPQRYFIKGITMTGIGGR